MVCLNWSNLKEDFLFPVLKSKIVYSRDIAYNGQCLPEWAHRQSNPSSSGCDSQRPPKRARRSVLACPPGPLFMQGIRLTQWPYPAFPFPNLLQHASGKDWDVGSEVAFSGTREGNLFCEEPTTCQALHYIHISSFDTPHSSK